ncbi:MAG: sulfatase [Fimbriimonadaceae bacterium]|nr:sulfatase [Fimbriimonadaceae bacterium]
MTRRTALGGLATVAAASRLRAAPRRPNFVVFLIDDLGARDLGCDGSSFHRTPRIDQLAAAGMRFTQGYAACPVCSPTRAALLTGQYPARLHLTDWIAGHRRPFAKLAVPDWTMHLDPATRTLPELLRPLGYRSASFGKWHLGGPAYYPAVHGFDEQLAGTDRGQPPSYFAPYKIDTLPEGPAGEYLTDRLGEEAGRWIAAHRGEPFLLYLPHFAVHTPVQAPRELTAAYQARRRPGAPQQNAAYAAMLERVDSAVGRVLDELTRQGLDNDTVVVFTSDNGGLLPVTNNAPLRNGKGTLYEGGLRVPWIVRWPGAVAAGSTCDAPVCSIDLWPTLLDLAGAPAAGRPPVDGRSLQPLLTGGRRIDREALYWHYPHYRRTAPGGALRDGRWKLIEYYEDQRTELYDLLADPSESRDLATAEPARARELRARLAAWRRAVGAQMPTPNPAWDPAKDKPF